MRITYDRKREQQQQKPQILFCLFLCFLGPFEVYDVAPWTNAHLQMRKFSDRLKDLEELVQLFPSTDKNDAFGQYYTNDGKDAGWDLQYLN